jgi:hypothetical protein
MAVAGGACAAFAIGLGLLQSPLFGLLGSAMVLAGSAEYLLPIRYSLSAEGAEVRYGWVHLLIEWDRVRRVLVAGDSVKLSVFDRENRLEPFRGAVLRYGDPESGADAAAVLEAIDRFRRQSA